MKIGYFSPGWPSEHVPNGIVKYLDIMVKELKSSSHEGIVFSSHIYNSCDTSNIIDLSTSINQFQQSILCRGINKIFKKIGLSYLFCRDKKFVKNFAYCVKKIEKQAGMGLDIIEMEETYGWAKDLAGFVDMPIVVKLHGPWFLNGEALGVIKDEDFYERVRVEGEAIRTAAGVIAPSNCVLEEVKKYYKIDLPDARVIHNPIEKISNEKQWNYKNCKKNQILFIGRFDEHKGGDIVINSFNILAKENKNAKLIFAGPDRGIKIGEKFFSIDEYIENTISDIDIKRRIKYLGKISPDEANNLRRESNIIIMASKWENFANTILEALAMGCPTIGTESGGTPEIIKNNETGLLVKKEDSFDLAKKISLLLDDRELAIRLAKNAVVDVEERFDSHKLLNESIDYYKYIISNVSQ